MFSNTQLEALRREQANQLAELQSKVWDGAKAWAEARGAWPTTRITPPGVWAQEWEVVWRLPHLRAQLDYPSMALVWFDDERTYKLLIKHGRLRQLQDVWDQLVPHVAELLGTRADPPLLPIPGEAPTDSLDDRYQRNRKKLLKLMVDHLVEFPDADLTAPGARGVLATRAGISSETSLSAWFTGTGRTLHQVIADLLPEATNLAEQERERRRRHTV